MAEPTASKLDIGRERLRARQGAGARHDAPNAPARELDWARRGTAYFARKLNELSDSELWGDSHVEGWSRRHVIACTAYHARTLAHLIAEVRTGRAVELHADKDQREADISLGATLPAGALQHLVAHADIHLNVEWRDLANEHWDERTRCNAIPTVRDAPWARAKQVWLRAIDLNNGARLEDLPRDFLLALLTEKFGPLKEETDLISLTRSAFSPKRDPY